MKTKPTLIFALILLLGRGAPPQFVAVPSDLNREDAPKQVIEMTAERWHFTPDVIHVKQGTLVTIRIKAIDGTHGFELGDFEINERIEENEVQEVEFYAEEKGEYGFRCSHFCGIGHFAMTGKVIVE